MSTLQKIHLSISKIIHWRKQTSNGIPSFGSTTSYIGQLDIPYFHPGGLIHWLLICDLAEYEFCSPPIGSDLVWKLGGVPLHYSAKAKGGSGAIQAFEQIQKEMDITMSYPISEVLGDSLDWIVQYLNIELTEEIKQWMR